MNDNDGPTDLAAEEATDARVNAFVMEALGAGVPPYALAKALIQYGTACAKIAVDREKGVRK